MKRKRAAGVDGTTMYSTKAASCAKRAWLTLERDLGRRPGWMVSTDGSSTGWHSAVLVQPAAPAGTGQLRLRAKWGDMRGTRNVGAEASGFLLGIQSLPDGVASAHCLGDFLNALAFDCGSANYKHPVLVEVYPHGHALSHCRTPIVVVQRFTTNSARWFFMKKSSKCRE